MSSLLVIIVHSSGVCCWSAGVCQHVVGPSRRHTRTVHHRPACLSTTVHRAPAAATPDAAAAAAAS